jgi:hypothetical protein
MEGLCKYWPVQGRIIDPVTREVFCRTPDGRVAKTVEGDAYVWADLIGADSSLELEACITRFDGRGKRRLMNLLDLLKQADEAQVDLAVFLEVEALVEADPEEGLVLGKYWDHLRHVVQVLDAGRDYDICNDGVWLVFEWRFSWTKFGGGKIECPWRIWV